MIPARRWLWALLIIASPSPAAWLGTCPGPVTPAGTRILDTLLKPAGSIVSVVASEQPLQDCEMVELPVAAGQLQWARLLGPREADALSGGIILKSGDNQSRTVAPQEIIPLQENTSAPAAIPIAVELLPRLQARVFGTENRVTVRKNVSGIHIECEPGESPAGVLLGSAGGLKIPDGAAVALQFAAEARGSFRAGATDAAHEKKGEPIPLGIINPGAAEAAFNIPTVLDKASWRFWTIECPATAAQLTIRSVRLEASSQAKTPGRALWVWQPAAWQDNAATTLKQLRENGADTIFITVPLDASNTHVKEAAMLQRFVTAASALGIRVWAVTGDPRAVLPPERNRFAAMAAAYAAYNRAAAPPARLTGLQLDIEPYLNSGYSLDTDEWLAAYLDTLSRIRAQAMMPLDIAVPFWWGRQRFRNSLFLDHLGKLVDVISVMNYRTNRQQLIEFAAPFLDWGVSAKKSIRIGLEAGPLPDETLHVFRSSNRGDLWLTPLGTNTLILSINTAQANPSGRSYAYSHTINRRSSATTFHRNTGTMQKLLPELEAVWRAWPSFDGIALHGLDAD